VENENEKGGRQRNKNVRQQGRMHGRCTSARDLLASGGGARRATLQKKNFEQKKSK
jgi:hypothetical protein